MEAETSTERMGTLLDAIHASTSDRRLTWTGRKVATLHEFCRCFREEVLNFYLEERSLLVTMNIGPDKAQAALRIEADDGDAWQPATRFDADGKFLLGVLSLAKNDGVGCALTMRQSHPAAHPPASEFGAGRNAGAKKADGRVQVALSRGDSLGIGSWCKTGEVCSFAHKEHYDSRQSPVATLSFHRTELFEGMKGYAASLGTHRCVLHVERDERRTSMSLRAQQNKAEPSVAGGFAAKGCSMVLIPQTISTSLSPSDACDVMMCARKLVRVLNGLLMSDEFDPEVSTSVHLAILADPQRQRVCRIQMSRALCAGASVRCVLAPSRCRLRGSVSSPQRDREEGIPIVSGKGQGDASGNPSELMKLMLLQSLLGGSR